MAVKDVKTPNSGANSKNAKTPARVGNDSWRDERPSPFSIEGIRSGATQSKVVKGFIIGSGVVMAFGFIMSSLNPTGIGGGNGNRGPINVGETVAQVGDETISRGDLEASFEQQKNQMEMFGQKTTPENYLVMRSSTLQGLTDNAALIVAAQKVGITVSSDDVEKEIQKQIGESLKPQAGETEAAFRRRIEAQHGSLDKFRDEMQQRITPEVRAQVEKGLIAQKLKKNTEDANKVTEADYKRSVTKLKLWQIVLRPELPKGDIKDFAAAQKKGTEKAEQDAKTLFEKLKATPTLAAFKAAAKKDSDDLLTKPKGGDYGWKLPKEIAPVEASDVVAKATTPLVGPFADTMGNQTIFFVESHKTELPKDYAKNKKKLLTAFETEQDSAAWQKRQTELQKSVAADIQDPALNAYHALSSPDFYSKPTDEQQKIRESALSQLQSALGSAQGLEAAALNLQIAQVNRDLGHKPEQIAALQAAVKAAPDDASLRVQAANALRDGGQTKQALEELKAASKTLDEAPPSLSPYGDPSAQTRAQIADAFTQLKQPKLADAERKKMKSATPPGGGSSASFGMPGGLSGLPPGVKLVPSK